MKLQNNTEVEEPEDKKENLRRRLNLTSWDNTFENFKVVKGTELALKLFKELASGEASWFLLLCYGTAGSGKSHLCEALSIALAKRNIACCISEWSHIVRNLKRAMHSEYKDAYDSTFERLLKVPQLIIDDIGSGSTGSNWEWGELEDIVSFRSRDRDSEKPLTVLTTNLGLEELPDRIVSRFRDAVKGRIAFISAGDYRPGKR